MGTTGSTTSVASSTTGSTTSEASSTTTGHNTATWKDRFTGRTTESVSEEPDDDDDDDDDEPEEGSLEALTNWGTWEQSLDEEDIIWFQGNMLMAGGEEDGERGGMLGALLNMGAGDNDVSPEPPVEEARIEELTDWAPLDKEVDGEELIWFRGD